MKKKTIPQGLMKKIMFFLFCMYSIGILAQNIVVTGYVTDAREEPLVGVTIQIQGTSHGTVTNFDGSYRITNVPTEAILEVSYVGMQSQVINVNGRTVINIVLLDDAELLDEVVVVGYGIQKKVSVTGAISTVDTKDLVKSTSPNLAAALAGRLPGLTAIQTSGQPGNDEVVLYLRGIGTLNDATPLILIDGIPRSNISTLDPNEIETVSILKDASATAVFGVRGANGVILITTRRGEAGKTQLNVRVNHSMQKFLVKADRLHSWEFAQLRNEAFLNDNPNATADEMPFTQYMIDKYISGEDPVFYPDRDIFNEFFKVWTPQTRANINFNGGGDKFRYFLNVGYIDQGGNYKTEPKSFLGYDPSFGMNRYNFRGNIDYNIFSNLNASLNIATYLQKMFTPQTVDLYGGSVGAMVSNMLDYIWATPPTDPGPTTVEGYGVPSNEIVTQSGQDRNIFAELNRKGYREGLTNNLNSSLTMDWGLDFITKGLSARGTIAFDSHASTVLNGVRQMDTYAAFVARNENEISGYTPIRSNQDFAIRLSKSSSTRYYTNYQVSLNYARTFGNHNVTGMLLYQRDNWDQYGADLPFNVVGIVGRATYNYDNRYLGEFNYGYNGSEQFAPKNRFGSFPALSLGWVISNEKFLEGNNVLTNLKLRFSHGLTGNDKLGGERFLYQSFLSHSYPGTIGVLGRQYRIVEGRIGNESIQWEVAKKTNLAIDVELLKSLSMTLDIFNENRNKILIARNTIPQVQGIPMANIPRMNIGEVENKGFEVELTYRKVINNNLSFMVKGNYAYNNNTVIFADEVEYGDDYVYKNRRTGFSIGQQFGYKIDYSNGNGYINTQEELDNLPVYEVGGVPRLGDFKYIDMNKDGVVNDRDMVPIGYPTVPRIAYGFSGSLNYKNVDFTFLFNGVGQTSRYTIAAGATEFALVGFYSGWHRNAWTAERYAKGEKILYPALGMSSGVSQIPNDVFIMDRSFLRLKLIELGYTLPKNILTPIPIESLRIYTSGNDLLTFHKMPINTVDPAQSGTLGFLAYPLTKMINFGININF